MTADDLFSEPSQIKGLDVVNRETGETEHHIAFTRGELEMPGYVESVERGYEGTTWRTVRVPADAERELWAVEMDGRQIPAPDEATAQRWAAEFGGESMRWVGSEGDHLSALRDAYAGADAFIQRHVRRD